MSFEGEGFLAGLRRPIPSPSGLLKRVASRLPSGLKATLLTLLGMSLEGEGFLPGQASHTFTVLS